MQRSSIHQYFADTCYLVVALRTSNREACDILASKVCPELLALLPQCPRDAVVTLVASLAEDRPSAAPSENEAALLQYAVLHVEPHDVVAVPLKGALDALREVKRMDSIVATGWVERAMVNEHCNSSARGASVIINPPATALEQALKAKRLIVRKRPSTDEVATDDDVFDCLVLYLPASAKTSTSSSASEASSISETMRETTNTAEGSSILAKMESIAIERHLPVVQHYLDAVKHRFFLRMVSPLDAVRSRDLFVAVARECDELRNTVGLLTLKICSLSDMRAAGAPV